MATTPTSTVRFTQWRTTATQLQQSYLSAKTAWDAANLAAAANPSLREAAAQAGFAAHQAARTYNGFLNSDRIALDASLTIYYRLNDTNGPMIEPIERQAMVNQRQQLDAFAFDFQSYKGSEQLRPVSPDPVNWANKNHYVTGRTEWDQSARGQVGVFWDFLTSKFTSALNRLDTYENCVAFTDFLRGKIVQEGLLKGITGTTGMFGNKLWEKTWEEVIDKTVTVPPDPMCRFYFPGNSSQVPAGVRQYFLSNLTEGFDPIVGQFTFVDVPIADLAAVGMGKLLSQQVAEGTTSQQDAQLWLRNATGSPSASLPHYELENTTAAQLVASLPIDLDETLWMGGGVMSGAWSAPQHSVEYTGNTTTFRDVDQLGGVTTTVVESFASGASQTTIQLPNGTLRVEDRDEYNQLAQVDEVEIRANDTVRRTYDGTGTLLTQTFTTTRFDGSQRIQVVNADGSSRTTVLDANGNVTSVKDVSAVDSQVIAQTAVINDVTALVNAIKRGTPLPILNSGLQLTNNIANLNGAQVPYLNSTAQVAAGIASLYNLANAFQNGDTLNQVSATVSTLVSVNSALQASGLGSQALDGFVQGTGVAEAVPYLGVVLAIKNGDYTGAAVAVTAMSVPVVGWAYAAYTLITALGTHAPDPWGMARPVFSAGNLYDANGKLITTVTLDVAGESTGVQFAQNGMQGALGYLQGLVDQANAAAGSERYGLIPQRMAQLTWQNGSRADPGYAIIDIDPITGAQRYPLLRWDDTGVAFSADPTRYQVDPLDPNTRAGYAQRLVTNALERGAVAPLWEVQTARLQQQAGDPYAGLTETERAGRSGQLAPIDPVTNKHVSGQFRPVALDLNHSGTIGLVGKDAPGNDVAFDWDDSGFYKQTAWLAQGDGFLFLDRNANGVVDAGSELFSNSTVADSFKGVRSLAWVDANNDGVLTSADPVFNQLRIWKDLNADGDNVQTLANGTKVEDAGEIQTLAQLGITELDYGSSRFTQGGALYSMASPELQADAAGTRVNVVQGGILIEGSSGENRLIVTAISGAGNGADSVPGFEDGAGSTAEKRTTARPIDIPRSLLLANDGANPGAMTITSVLNASHGSVSLGTGAQAAYVTFTPEANFNGNASFQYVAVNGSGVSRTFDVTVVLAPVADDPVVTSVEAAGRAIYGYRPVYYSYTVYVQQGTGENSSNVPVNIAGVVQGEPVYVPHVEEIRGAPIYGPVWVGSGEDGHYENQLIGYEASTFVNRFTPIATERATTGQIGAIDPDGAATFTYEKLTDGQFGRAVVNPTNGSWSYEAFRPNGVAAGDLDGNGSLDYVDPNTGAVLGANPGNAYLQNRYGGGEAALGNPGWANFLDSFRVRVTDGNGGITEENVQVVHYGPRQSSAIQTSSKKPIAIDLNGDGFQFTDVDDSNVFFDVNGDGWRRRTSWIGPQDGLLVIDRNGDGKITAGNEIAFIGDKNGAQTDLAGLAGFDTNGDGKFTAADRDWAKFGVWRDANTNGVTDAGEFLSLAQMGISEIALTSDGLFRVINGQTVHGVAAITKTNGTTLQAADVSFRWSNEVQLSNAAGVSRVVDMPNQQAGQNYTGTAGKDLTLGTGGTDTFTSGAADDVVMDDAGNDRVDAGDGNDLVYTGQGNDVVLLGNGNDTAFAGDGNDLVIGDGAGGTGDDLIMLEGGNDIAFGGNGNDFLAGGDGNDVVTGDAGDDKLFGEQGWDALFGKVGDDELWGGEGNDMLYGDAGKDLLIGGAGDDAMEGGVGDDTYEVDSLADTVTELAGEGSDSVRASISYTLGATLENLTLTGTSSLQGTGNPLDNVLVGNDGNNTLTGLAGNDTLDGGLGADTLAGGVGNDTYVVDNVGDAVAELANEGTDAVRSRITTTLSANVENLTLIGIGAIDGTGNTLANAITGNAAANRIDGGAGADQMAGGAGNDTYVVREAGDVVSELANEGYDTVESYLTGYTLGANVEALVLVSSAGVVQGTGNALGNTLIGNDVANTLDGAAGADLMAGGLGDDTYLVDNAGDAVVESLNAGSDTIRSSISFALADNVENLLLTGTSAIDGTGNSLNNVLTGNAGANLLDGAAGADAMSGGAGNDVYVVDNVADAVTELANEGTDTVRSSVTLTLGNNVENLTLVGTSAIDGTGNAFDNVLTGNGAANVLSGGAGNDTYVVSTGDTVTEAAGAGTDTVQSDVSWTLGVNLENLTLTGIGAINGTGNTLNNVITGNAAANTLDGGTGTDTLVGGAGNDIYVVDAVTDVVTELAGEGTDTIQSGVTLTLGGNVENLTLTGSNVINGTGNTLDNVLTGNSAANTLTGGAGNDTLDGGAGIDTLVGGAGNDTYVVDVAGDIVTELASEGTDTIQSGVTLTLGNNVENLTLTGSIAIDGTGNTLDNVITGNSAANALAGGAGNDTLNGGGGADVLDGGTGADVMIGGSGDDWYYVDSTGDVVNEAVSSDIDDRIYTTLNTYALNDAAGAGVDDLRFAGTGNFTGTGNSFDNWIYGGAGNDSLSGGAGADVLDGGAGSDAMNGGTGNDWYYVDSVGDVVNEAASAENDDRIYTTLNSLALNDAAGAGVDDLIFEGVGNFSGTGNSADNAIYGAAGNDSLDGGAGADYLSGGAGTDSLVGGIGGDILDGGAGADTMSGGAGDDWYYVDNIGDVVNEAVSAGVDDRVYTTLGTYALNDAASAGVEDLVYQGAGSFIGTGNSSTNWIYGGAGNDTLDGAAGSDFLYGGLGADTYVVDNVNDLVEEYAGEGTDTVRAGVSWTLAANIENLTLTGAGAIDGTGNTLDNVITGNGAANTLDGGAGVDTLVGGAGNDTYVVDVATDVVTELLNEGTDTVRSSVTLTLGNNVENLTLIGSGTINGTGNALDNVLSGNGAANVLTGGAGNDTYVVSTGDTVTEAASAGTDTVQSDVSWTLGVNLENLTLTGAGAINGTGNPLNNVITGNAAANTLDGGAGSDTLIGGAGNDTYVVDVLADVVTEQAGEGTDTVQTNITLTLGNNVENLVLTGTGLINGTGNTLDNVLTGNSAANTLTGGLGNDTLDGGAGVDTLVGGAGNDIYVVDLATDVVTELASEGTDTVQSSITLTLGNNLENLTLIGSSVINGTGNILDNVLTGNGAANVLTGGAGNDTLDGGAGADTLIGGAGNDTYVVDAPADVVTELAAEGTDTVQSTITLTLGNNVENLTLIGSGVINGTGNALDNVLTGNGAANVLTGGAGNDTYVVSTGDTVTEGAGAGTDTVQSDVTWTLGVNLENLTLTGAGANNGTGNTLNNVITGNAAANTLDGGAGTDTMIGGAGNDTYVVDVTADVVTELAGEGTDTVQSNITLTLGNNVENLTLIGTGLINGTGNALDNVLTGNSAANTLTGDVGNDTLDGGAGVDTLVGGAGNDTYVVDVATDVVTELLNEGTDTVRSSVMLTLGNNVENLTLIGSGAINGTGNALDNVLTGNGAANVLTGGAGNDTYVVSTGDTVTEAASAGTDTVQSDVSWTLGVNLENLTLTGAGAINGTGNTLNNVITGNAAANTLDGGSGTDTLIGGAGNDIYVVDAAADVVTELAGEGTDTVQTNITLTLGNNVENLTLTGTGLINGTGNTLDNVLTGNSAANVLTGGTGNDTYVVSTGDTTTEAAGAGTDTVQSDVSWTLGSNLENLTLMGAGAINGTGNTLNNILFGNAGANTLAGAAGDDTYDGGAGNDVYTDSDTASNDTYRFGIGSGTDTLTDAGGALDHVDLYAGITRTQMLFARNVNNLELSLVGQADKLVINGWYAAAANQVEEFRLADGTVLLASQFQSLVSGAAPRTLATSTSAIDPWTALQAEISLIADQVVGLPTNIAPEAPLRADNLVAQALQASSQRRSTMLP